MVSSLFFIVMEICVRKSTEQTFILVCTFFSLCVRIFLSSKGKFICSNCETIIFYIRVI